MIASLNPFLNFAGDAKAAIALYEKALGAKVEAIMPWTAEMMGGGDVPPGMTDKVMYAKLAIGNGAIELSDVPPGIEVGVGNNHQVILHIETPDKLDKIFNALGDGGEVQMPPENMFWGARYAKLVDRFGISWAFHCQLEPPPQ